MAWNDPRPDSVSELFVTPLLRRLCPGAEAANPRLREIILERERNAPGINRSNVGGWQSDRQLLEWPYPEIAGVRDWIIEAVKQVTGHTFGGHPVRLSGSVQIVAWANVLRRGNFNRVHNHPGMSWSGVYYVDLGGAPRSEDDGTIELVDPRSAANMVATPGRPFDQKVRVRPGAGEIILFPSWLQHFVNPYEGDDVRISIPFNVSLQQLKVAG